MTIYINGTSGISGVDGSAGTPAIQGTDGNTGISFPAADTIAFNEGGAEAARIDSSGRFLVGTSSTSGNATLHVNKGSSDGTDAGGLLLTNLVAMSSTGAGDDLGYINFGASTTGGVASYDAARILCEADATWGTNDYPSRLVFSTTADGASSPTERLRINNVGRPNFFVTNSDGVTALSNAAAGTTYSLIQGSHSATGVTDGTRSFVVYTNGNVQNTNNSYTGISDLKLKENISDAKSQWSDIKALRVVNYNFKPETNFETYKQIGLVAQEVELVSPGLVTESADRDEEGNDLGAVTKSVNYSVLYMKAVKALQEAMERIETLEASNTDLLARVSALESA